MNSNTPSTTTRTGLSLALLGVFAILSVIAIRLQAADTEVAPAGHCAKHGAEAAATVTGEKTASCHGDTTTAAAAAVAATESKSCCAAPVVPVAMKCCAMMSGGDTASAGSAHHH